MLTPAQIRGHRFAPAVRGAYKAEDVDAFFAEVLESYEKVLNDNGELLKRISLLAERVEAYRNDEDNIKVALLTAQRMADKMVKDANETAAEQLKSAAEKLAYAEAQATAQAKMIIEKAQKEAGDTILNADIEATRLVKDAQAEADETRRTATREAQVQLSAVREDVRMETILLSSLKHEAEEFKNTLLQLYNKQLSLIDSIPGEVAQTAPEPSASPIVAETAEEEEPAEDPFEFFSNPTSSEDVPFAEENEEAVEVVFARDDAETDAEAETETEAEVCAEEPTTSDAQIFDESGSRTDAAPITSQDIESLFNQVDTTPVLSEPEVQSTQEEPEEEASARFVSEPYASEREDDLEDSAGTVDVAADADEADYEKEDDRSSPESHEEDDDDPFGFLDDEDDESSDDGFRLDLDELDTDENEASAEDRDTSSLKSVFETIEYDEDDDDDSQPRFRGFFKK